MPRDVIVHVTTDSKPRSSEALSILLLSTEVTKDMGIYRSVDEISAAFPDTILLNKAKALFNQPNTLASTLIRKVKCVGLGTVDTPAALLAGIEALRQTDDDWYLLITDKAEDEYIKALAAWAERTEPTEAELGAGIEDHRKCVFAQTASRDLGITNRRAIIIYTDDLTEQADAAYVGNVGPFYPTSVTWKFKRPDGLAVSEITDAQRDALEDANVNFMTREYKREYIKNGVCADGEYIDVMMGADYIAQYMREALYDVFLKNAKVPYTDVGFAQVAGAVFASLNRATTLGIIATDPETKAGVYSVVVPTLARATEDEARERRIPDIGWEAQLEGAVHSVKVSGTLKATLAA